VDDGVVSRATLSDVETIASVKGSEVNEDEFQEDSDVEKVQDPMVIQNADEVYRMVNALRLFQLLLWKLRGWWTKYYRKREPGSH